jgi:hypothetical protein
MGCVNKPKVDRRAVLTKDAPIERGELHLGNIKPLVIIGERRAAYNILELPSVGISNDGRSVEVRLRGDLAYFVRFIDEPDEDLLVGWTMYKGLGWRFVDKGGDDHLMEAYGYPNLMQYRGKRVMVRKTDRDSVEFMRLAGEDEGGKRKTSC